MKILVTEQQLSEIIKKSNLNESDLKWKYIIYDLKSLESEEIKRYIKNIIDLCERFEYNGGIYFVFQQIPTIRPENLVFKDNRREIALYVKPNTISGFGNNIIFYNNFIFNKLNSKHNVKDIIIKYNIIDTLIDENIIAKNSITYGLKKYYHTLSPLDVAKMGYDRDKLGTSPLTQWINNSIHRTSTADILNKTGLRNLRELDLHSMKVDEFGDEGLSGFSKLKRNINKRLTGLDTKESYFVSKLANIFDMAVKDEKNSNSYNIPDENGDDYKIFHTNPCTVFLKNAPIKGKESLISYLESLKTISPSLAKYYEKRKMNYDGKLEDIFTKIIKKAANKSSNRELKNSIKYCLSGNPIKFR